MKKIKNNNVIEFIGHCENDVLCAKVTSFCNLIEETGCAKVLELKSGYAKFAVYNEEKFNKLYEKVINEELKFESEEILISLTSPEGVTLATEGKYCDKNIKITPVLQEKTVTTNGETIADSGNVGLSKVIINVPSTPTEIKTVELSMASGNQVITPTSGKVLSQITVTKPATMLPENIKKDITIGGIIGTLESGGGGLDLSQGALVLVGNIQESSSYYSLWGYGETSSADTSTFGTNEKTVNIITPMPTYLKLIPGSGSSTAQQISSLPQFNVYAGVLKGFGEFSQITTWTNERIATNLHNLVDDWQNSCIFIYAGIDCLIEGTLVTLADGTEKPIEDITYDDKLLVWDFFTGKYATSKPRTIKIEETIDHYNLVKFSNGVEIGFVGTDGTGYHRIFNKETGRFSLTGSNETPNGTTTFSKNDNEIKVVSQEIINKTVKYYNVIPYDHYNLFANGILTGSGMENRYLIKNMKYIGERLNTDEEIEETFKKKRNFSKSLSD